MLTIAKVRKRLVSCSGVSFQVAVLPNLKPQAMYKSSRKSGSVSRRGGRNLHNCTQTVAGSPLPQHSNTERKRLPVLLPDPENRNARLLRHRGFKRNLAFFWCHCRQSLERVCLGGLDYSYLSKDIYKGSLSDSI